MMRRWLLLLPFLLPAPAFAQGAFLLGAAPPATPVAFDANATSVTSGALTSPATNASLTVGSGANRCMIVQIATTGTMSAISVTWNGGASMYQIGTFTNAASITTYLYGMVAPASGNNTISVSWTGSSVNAAINGTSFTGCNQTGSATTFTNFTQTNGNSNNPNITMTNPANNLAVDLVGAVFGVVSTNETLLFIENTTTGSASSYTTSVNPTFSWVASSAVWSELGVSIAHN